MQSSIFWGISWLFKVWCHHRIHREDWRIASPKFHVVSVELPWIPPQWCAYDLSKDKFFAWDLTWVHGIKCSKSSVTPGSWFIKFSLKGIRGPSSCHLEHTCQKMKPILKRKYCHKIEAEPRWRYWRLWIQPLLEGDALLFPGDLNWYIPLLPKHIFNEFLSLVTKDSWFIHSPFLSSFS